MTRPKLVAGAAVVATLLVVAMLHLVAEGDLWLMIEIFAVFAFAQSWNPSRAMSGSGPSAAALHRARVVLPVSRLERDRLGTFRPAAPFVFAGPRGGGHLALRLPAARRLFRHQHLGDRRDRAAVHHPARRARLGQRPVALRHPRHMVRSTVANWTFYYAGGPALLSGCSASTTCRSAAFGLALAVVRDSEGIGGGDRHQRLVDGADGFVLGSAFHRDRRAVYYMSVFHVDPGGAFDPNWMVIMLFVVIIGGVAHHRGR